MHDTIYISGDITAQIDELDPVVTEIQEDTPGITVEIDSLTVGHGNMPRGGNPGDIIVKTGEGNYAARWMSVDMAGLRHIYYDTTHNWNLQPDLISEHGSFYIYSDKSVLPNGDLVPGIKIGDGLAYVIDLPFVSQDITEQLYAHINNASMHVSAADRYFWDHKVTSLLDNEDKENLILTMDLI